MERRPFSKANQAELLRAGQEKVEAALERLRRGEGIEDDHPTQEEMAALDLFAQELRDEERDVPPDGSA